MLLSRVGKGFIKILASLLHENIECISHLKYIEDMDEVEKPGLWGIE